MTIKSKRGGRRENQGGRPPLPLDERKAWRDKVTIRISLDAALKLQRLMLTPIDGVHTPEQMVEHLINQASKPNA